MKKISEMTLKEKIGQLVVCGFKSPYYDEQIEELVNNYNVGNVILFTRNYEGANELKKLNKELYQKIEEKTGLIPLIAIDQEGGPVTRLMKDVTFPPSQMTTSATAFPKAAYEAGKMIGRDMIMLGLNWNLAPCLEINDGLKMFVHNVRSYGSDKEKCASLAHDFSKGLKEYGVMGCLKHFPGSGDSKVDSHLDLPVLSTPLERLLDHNLVPFKANLDTKSIMTAHVVFNDIDKKYPSTLSKKVLKGILRDTLGYDGIVVSDCTEMKAIENYYGTGRGSALALIAGCDMVLACHTLEKQKECFEAIYESVEKGELTEEEIDKKLERIIKAKKEIKPYLDKYFFNDDSYEIDPKSVWTSQKIVDESITLVKGKLPLLKEDTMVLAPVASVSSIVEDEFSERDLSKALKKKFNNLIYKFSDDEGFKEEVLSKLNDVDEVIIFSYDANKSDIQKELINKIIEEKKDKAFLISLKGPMDLCLFEEIENYSVLYEYTPNSINSVIKYISGLIDAKGHLPL